MPVNLFVPSYETEECLDEIRECLEKGWTGLGFKTIEFERRWCEYTGLPHAHFLSSGTAALHLAVHVLRTLEHWADGDEVVTSPLTFISSNHVILYERLKPVFADVDDMLCLDPGDVERKITSRTRAVMFVGIGGNTGQLPAIKALCARRGLKLILDAAHMAGTRLHGRAPDADVVCHSFHAVKPLATADAGMVCFADPAHDAFARKQAWMGISKDTYTRTAAHGAYRWHYDVESVGWKYHGNSIMAAIGLVQLKYLDRDNAYRRQLSQWYEAGLAGAAHVGMVPVAAGCEPSRHLFQIHVDYRDEMMLALNESDIYPGVHYRDNRAYPMFREDADSCPMATRMSGRIISLPLHLRLTKLDVDTVVAAVRRYAR